MTDTSKALLNSPERTSDLVAEILKLASGYTAIEQIAGLEIARIILAHEFTRDMPSLQQEKKSTKKGGKK